MSIVVTTKGQVTIPKAVRDAAGIRPGDRVDVRALPNGGVIVEPSKGERLSQEAYRARLEAVAARRPFAHGFPGKATDEIMAILRGDD